MPALLQFIDDRARENFQKAVHVIYVEGEEDVDFMDLLYPDCKRDILFVWAGKSSDDPDIECSGGCDGVIARVRGERERNKKVYGIVDRDVYKTKRDFLAFLEADNNNFPAKINDSILVLRRWEIKNYFVDSAVLEYSVRRALRENASSQVNEADIINKLIEICESLIVISAASLALHIHKLKDFPPLWGYPLGPAKDVVRKVVSDKNFQGKKLLTKEFCIRLKEVRRFDCGGSNKKVRLLHLLRIVDGKRLFAHFEKCFQLKGDVRRLAASDCREKRVDTEDLAAFIESLIR